MNRFPDTIVLSRPDRLGDVVITTATIRPLLEQHPGSRVVFAARRAWLPLLRGHPLLADCIDVDQPLAVLTARLRELHPDAIVHFHPHADLYTAARDAGVAMRVGYWQDDLPGTLTHGLTDRRTEGGKHEALFNFDLLALLAIAPPARPRPEIHLPKASRRSLEQQLERPIDALQPYVVLHPSAHLGTVRWPVRHFCALARLIRARTTWRLVLTGDDASEAATREVAARLGGVALNLAGRTDVAELGWLLECAAGVVTRDTGPSHLAGAVGAPTVSIWGRNDPENSPLRWGALGPRVESVGRSLPRRWFESRRSNWRRSFASISPEEVFQALLRVSSLPERAG